MADMESVITGALAEARESGDLPAVETDAVDTTVVDDSVGESTEVVETKVEAGTEKTTEEKKTEEVVDALMEELLKEGFKPDKREKVNKIPYPNVQKIIGNREKRAVESVAKALGVDVQTLKFDGLEAAITEKLSGYSGFEEERENFNRVQDLATTDPDRYIRILATVEPEKYSKFLPVLEGKGGKTEEEEDPDAEILKEMPEMDVVFKLPDGTDAQTYSPKALQKMFVTAVRMGEKRAEAQAKSVVEPINSEREQQRRNQELQNQTHTELETALKWNGMDEYFDDVLTAMKEDSKQATDTKTGKLNPRKLKYRNVRDAYIDIVPAKLKDSAIVSEQKIRAKILEEGKTAVKDTSVSTETGSKVVISSEDPITDAIVKSIRGLKR